MEEREFFFIPTGFTHILLPRVFLEKLIISLCVTGRKISNFRLRCASQHYIIDHMKLSPWVDEKVNLDRKWLETDIQRKESSSVEWSIHGIYFAFNNRNKHYCFQNNLLKMATFNVKAPRPDQAPANRLEIMTCPLSSWGAVLREANAHAVWLWGSWQRPHLKRRPKRWHTEASWVATSLSQRRSPRLMFYSAPRRRMLPCTFYRRSNPGPFSQAQPAVHDLSQLSRSSCRMTPPPPRPRRASQYLSVKPHSSLSHSSSTCKAA